MAKRSSLVLFISIIFNLTVQAQQGIRFYMRGFNLYPVVVRTVDSADFLRYISTQDSTDHLYPVNDFYKNGKPKMTGKSVTADPMLRLKGHSVDFFPNGNKKAERNYDNNRRVGDLMLYYPNGKLYLTGRYNNNDKLIISECRDSTGKILAKNGNGYFTNYTDDFKFIWAEGNITNGVEEGKWHGRLNDTITYVCNYNSGIVTGGISYGKNGKEYPFTKAEVEPQYPEGINAFYKFIGENVHYPKAARKHNIQGKVFVSFVIEKDGTLSDVHVIRGIGGGCDEEAVRVIKLSPSWTPGIQYGIPVRVQYNIPLAFALGFDN